MKNKYSTEPPAIRPEKIQKRRKGSHKMPMITAFVDQAAIIRHKNRMRYFNGLRFKIS